MIKENGYKLSDSHNGTNFSAMVLKVWPLQASSENMLKNTSSLALPRPTESQIFEGYASNPCFKKHSKWFWCLHNAVWEPLVECVNKGF